MNKIKIAASQLAAVFSEEAEAVTEDDVFSEIDRGAWDDEGKYQYLPIYIKSKKTDKVYVFNVQRSGSYFSDYNYEFDEDAHEVEEKEVTHTVWSLVA